MCRFNEQCKDRGRIGVSRAAHSAGRKLIRYSGGWLTILDRDGLEAAACGRFPRAKNVRP
jgi:hypothetical protein